MLTVHDPRHFVHENPVQGIWVIIFKCVYDVRRVVHLDVSQTGVGHVEYQSKLVIVGLAEAAFDPVDHNFLQVFEVSRTPHVVLAQEHHHQLAIQVTSMEKNVVLKQILLTDVVFSNFYRKSGMSSLMSLASQLTHH